MAHTNIQVRGFIASWLVPAPGLQIIGLARTEASAVSLCVQPFPLCGHATQQIIRGETASMLACQLVTHAYKLLDALHVNVRNPSAGPDCEIPAKNCTYLRVAWIFDDPLFVAASSL